MRLTIINNLIKIKNPHKKTNNYQNKKNNFMNKKKMEIKIKMRINFKFYFLLYLKVTNLHVPKLLKRPNLNSKNVQYIWINFLNYYI
jgi:hypothetical protein